MTNEEKIQYEKFVAALADQIPDVLETIRNWAFKVNIFFMIINLISIPIGYDNVFFAFITVQIASFVVQLRAAHLELKLGKASKFESILLVKLAANRLRKMGLN